ncbi:ABC transporter ATP-binding protein [Metabacillus fastidiosus]|uniref:ABC transporter ATP-binding protein n=1 Tax=Metabacillus fastidiosus TaxID=1458 RepID=UPI003D29A2A1
MGFLVIDDVSYSYKDAENILRNIDLTIEQKEIHCLVGRSGCGKTTLLKLASGLLAPVHGNIYMKDSKVLKPSSEVGFVFQAPTLLEWKSVLDNILLPISLKRKITEADRARAVHLLEMMGLESYGDYYPTELSGGQQSRIAIARALIKKPSMLFLDEPFAALDAITREELQDDLVKLCQMENISVLFITHDLAEAVYLGDRVSVMERGEIVYRLDVPLQRPRIGELRYDPLFNELCLKVKSVMSGESS